MRYSGGASNDILGPGNGSVANAIAHYGGPGHVGSDHLWPRRYDQTNPLSKDHLWIDKDGVGTEISPLEIPNQLFNHQLNHQSSGMYNNGYIAGGPQLFPIPKDINKGEVRGTIQGVQGGVRNDLSKPYGGLQGMPQATNFLGKQEIPQISTGPYTGTPWEGFGPIGTYKGGSFAVPLPYYG